MAPKSLPLRLTPRRIRRIVNFQQTVLYPIDFSLLSCLALTLAHRVYDQPVISRSFRPCEAWAALSAVPAAFGCFPTPSLDHLGRDLDFLSSFAGLSIATIACAPSCARKMRGAIFTRPRRQMCRPRDIICYERSRKFSPLPDRLLRS